MINELVHAQRSINNIAYHNNLAINSLNYARFFLPLAEIDHILNQLLNGLRKLEIDVTTIYNI